MNWLRTILREIFGLFVDDGTFALIILAWLTVMTVIFPHMGWLPHWRGLILFCGLALILVVSAVRYARKKLN